MDNEQQRDELQHKNMNTILSRRLLNYRKPSRSYLIVLRSIDSVRKRVLLKVKNELSRNILKLKH